MKTNAQTADLQAENTALKTENAELKLLVKYYEGQLRLSKHRQFGASSEKSEYDFGQLSLFNDAELFADENASEPELIEVEKHYRKRTRLTTDKLPEDLSVEVIEYELPEDEQVCPECGGGLHVMGRDVRRELVIIPAQVKIREHVRRVYSCRGCERNAIEVPVLKAPVPEPVIKGSFASPEAIAHIMVQKFVMGVPLYRQEQEWKRQGIELSRQTMSNWLIKAAGDWLEPIYDALHKRLLTHRVLHGDETTLQVLREPGKTAQSKSYMWEYRTSGGTEHPIILFDYQPSRKAQHPKDFLTGFAGYLHADGYDGYHKLPENIVVVGCWSHLRRKFDEALKALPDKDREGSNVLRGKRYCDQLFELERKFAGLTPDERLEQRLELAWPVVKEFFAWAESVKAVPKSMVAKFVKTIF